TLPRFLPERRPKVPFGGRMLSRSTAVRGPCRRVCKMVTDQLDPDDTTAELSAWLRSRRERLGYVGDGGIDEIAEAAAIAPDRWRAFEAGDAAPTPDQLPRLALALVNPFESGPADDPAAVLDQLRR